MSACLGGRGARVERGRMSKPCRAERSNRGSEVTREISVNTSADNAGRLADCAWAKREVSFLEKEGGSSRRREIRWEGKKENKKRETRNERGRMRQPRKM